jgi:TolB-like protein
MAEPNAIPGSIAPETALRLIEKICSSKAFANSERMARFLSFTVKQTIAGCGRALKEYVIGIEVFDRPASFESRLDPIVRVEARRLRSKLAAYYEQEGRNDDWTIEIPKGSCRATFIRRIVSRRFEPVAPLNTIAVLPFQSLGLDPGNEGLCAGLSEELIHAFTKAVGVHVVAADSLGEFRNANFLLRGSVRCFGEWIRVTAHLIDTQDGRYVWSEVYRRRSRDWMVMEQELAGLIVAQLPVGDSGGGRRVTAYSTAIPWPATA